MQNNNKGQDQGQMGGGGNQMTAQQQQQYRAAMQQQQLAAMQAARAQQGGGAATGMQARPQMPMQQVRPQGSGNPAQPAATQQQMQALQQLFQNHPEQLAAFVNMSREGKVSAEQLAQLREVVNAAQAQGQAARPPQQDLQQQQQIQQQQQKPPQQQQQQRPQAPAPQQTQQPGAQAQSAARPQQPRPGGPGNQIDLQKVMSQLQKMAEPISMRINQLDAQLSTPADKGGLSHGTPERQRAESELADMKMKRETLGQKFLAAKAQHLQQQGKTQEAQQLVQQMQQRQQQAAAAAAATSAGSGSAQSSASQQAAAAAAAAVAAVQRRSSAQPGASSSPAPGARPGAPPAVAAAAGQQALAGTASPSTSSQAQGGAIAATPHVPPEAMVQRPTVTSTGTTIPAQLHVAPSVPEPYPNSNGPRPTLTQGLNTNPMLGTPAILQRPDLITGASGSAAGASSGVLGQSNNWDELLGVPLRDSKGSNAFDSRLAAMSGEELANEMANPDFWDQMSGRGTGADSLLNSGSASAAGSAAALAASSNGRLLSKRKVQELVGEIDPSERLEGAVEDLLLEIADEFIDSVAQFACRLAKHRKGERLEVRDVQLHLERSWNLRIPTPGSMPIPPPRIKPATQSSAGKGNAAAAAANN